MIIYEIYPNTMYIYPHLSNAISMKGVLNQCFSVLPLGAISVSRKKKRTLFGSRSTIGKSAIRSIKKGIPPTQICTTQTLFKLM